MPNAEDDSPLVVFTTLANESDATTFVEDLINRRLIACGTLMPARSVYRWEGRVTQESEALVIMKTRRGQWRALQRAVTERHPYDVPELLALPVQEGLPDYVRWITSETVARDGESDS